MKYFFSIFAFLYFIKADALSESSKPPTPTMVDSVGTIEHSNVSGSSGSNVSDGFKWGSIGRSGDFDPFKRSRNIPFSIAGRRRSISIMTTIDENTEN